MSLLGVSGKSLPTTLQERGVERGTYFYLGEDPVPGTSGRTTLLVGWTKFINFFVKFIISPRKSEGSPVGLRPPTVRPGSRPSTRVFHHSLRPNQMGGLYHIRRVKYILPPFHVSNPWTGSGVSARNITT